MKVLLFISPMRLIFFTFLLIKFRLERACTECLGCAFQIYANLNADSDCTGQGNADFVGCEFRSWGYSQGPPWGYWSTPLATSSTWFWFPLDIHHEASLRLGSSHCMLVCPRRGQRSSTSHCSLCRLCPLPRHKNLHLIASRHRVRSSLCLSSRSPYNLALV